VVVIFFYDEVFEVAKRERKKERKKRKKKRKTSSFFLTFEYLGVTLTTLDASRETVLAMTAPQPCLKKKEERLLRERKVGFYGMSESLVLSFFSFFSLAFFSSLFFLLSLPPRRRDASLRGLCREGH